MRADAWAMLNATPASARYLHPVPVLYLSAEPTCICLVVSLHALQRYATKAGDFWTAVKVDCVFFCIP